MNRIIGSVLLSTAVLAMTACSTRPVQIDAGTFVDPNLIIQPVHGRLPVQPEPQEQAGKNACRVAIGDLVDQRRYLPILGYVAERRLDVVDLMGMLRNGIRNELLKSSEFLLVDDENADVTLGGTLIKGYMNSVSTSMTSTFVMNVDYVTADGASITKHARGMDTSVNWANGEHEIQRSLSHTVVNMVSAMQPTLREVCATSIENKASL